MAARDFDYIVVGQGLAGSAVAVQLLKRRHKILVIDQPEKNNSSRIAAGLFNPITGKKMVKTWMADIIFPYLHQYYREVEEKTDQKFFHSLPIYRPFLSVEEQNEWMARSSDSTFEGYIEKIYTSSVHQQLNDRFGGLMLKQSGYLDTSGYTAAINSWIKESGEFLEEDFDYSCVFEKNDLIHYKNITASHLIFCHGAHHNPWFDWLPVRPLKGETIHVKTNFIAEIIVNRGIYLVPGREPGEWRVGATYNFDDFAPGITEKGRIELEEKLTELVNFPIQCMSQQWGVRPTTPDRRPMLGSHPVVSRMHVFNGLGTKGVSLAPYFSEVLIRWIENGVPLNKVIDIERYKSLYSISPK